MSCLDRVSSVAPVSYRLSSSALNSAKGASPSLFTARARGVLKSPLLKIHSFHSIGSATQPVKLAFTEPTNACIKAWHPTPRKIPSREVVGTAASPPTPRRNGQVLTGRRKTPPPSAKPSAVGSSHGGGVQPHRAGEHPPNSRQRQNGA